jgi:hypothetical protein
MQNGANPADASPSAPVSEPPERRIIRRMCLFAAILITAAIVWLHFFFLFHAGGFWRDEVNLINLAASHSLAGMEKDSFPVLMPLLVRGWSAIGPGKGDLTLRLLGMLIGLGIPAAFWLAAWKTRQAPPLLSLSLFCLNGTLLVFGDSLRAYGLGSLLMVLTAAGAAAFLRRPSWRRTGGLALLATLSVQALFHNAILVGAVCAGVWAVCWRHKNWKAAAQMFLAGLAAAASLLTYAPGLMAGRESSVVLRTGLKSWRFAAAFQDALGFPLGGYFYVWAGLALALFVLAGAALCRARKMPVAPGDDMDDLSLFAGTTVLTAVAGFVLFLWLAAFPSQSWYLLPLMALAAVCFEIGLPGMRGKMRAPFLGLVAATALIAIPRPAVICIIVSPMLTPGRGNWGTPLRRMITSWSFRGFAALLSTIISKARPPGRPCRRWRTTPRTATTSSRFKSRTPTPFDPCSNASPRPSGTAIACGFWPAWGGWTFPRRKRPRHPACRRRL